MSYLYFNIYFIGDLFMIDTTYRYAVNYLV